MGTKDSKKSKLTNSERKKRGTIFLVIAAVCLVINGILPSPNTLGTQSAAMTVGLIGAVASLCLLIFFIGGLYYLITGFTKKE